MKLSLYRTFGKVMEFSVVLVMLGQELFFKFRSAIYNMDTMKSWAGIEEGKVGGSVCCTDGECESDSHVL